MHALLDRIEEHRGDIFTYWFHPEQQVRFSAGQYIELYLPHEDVDNRGTRRWLSISSSPSSKLVAVTTGFPEKPSSFKRTLRTLRIGDTVSLSDPLGDFVLPKDQTIPLVFIAAGTGSTPYASMIKLLTEQDEKRDIQLIYATSHPGAFLFSDIWDNYPPLHMTRMVSHAKADWHEHIGHLNVLFILQQIASDADSLIYLAGPQSLIEPIYDQLIRHIPRNRLLLDYFPGY